MSACKENSDRTEQTSQTNVEDGAKGALSKSDFTSTKSKILLKTSVVVDDRKDCAGKVSPEASVRSTKSTSSSSSISSKDNWSFEQLAKATDHEEVPYSEQTKKQIEVIKQLVEQQNRETAEKQAESAADDNHMIHIETANEESVREPEKEVSTTFSQAMKQIREEIRKAHEERERQHREAHQRKKEEHKRKAKKRDEHKEWPFAPPKFPWSIWHAQCILYYTEY